MKLKPILLTALASISLATSTTAQIVPSYVPTDGLVGWWPFNGNANDESGNGNNATSIGASLTNDRNGNANSAYFFNGNNNTIEIPSSQSLEPPTQLSVSVWVHPTGFGSGNFPHPIVKRLNPNSNTFGIVYGAGNSWGCGIETSTGSTGIYTGNNTFIVGQWILLTSTYNGNIHNIYVNGILTDSTSISGNIVYNSNYGWTLGYSTVFAQYFEGYLDDVAIYNRALTQQEITALYNTTITGLNPPSYQNTLKVFPNPANTQLTIDYSNFSSISGYKLKIVNSIGQTVFTTFINQQSTYIDISNWKGSGIYNVQLIDTQNNTIESRKIIIQ
jgi:hypothetical protein